MANLAPETIRLADLVLRGRASTVVASVDSDLNERPRLQGARTFYSVAGGNTAAEGLLGRGQMVRGLLMELDDHNCWTIAEAAGHRGPHWLQHLPSRAVWDDQHLVDIASR